MFRHREEPGKSVESLYQWLLRRGETDGMPPISRRARRGSRWSQVLAAAAGTRSQAFSFELDLSSAALTRSG